MGKIGVPTLDEQKAELQRMADTISQLARKSPGLTVDELLERAGRVHKRPASQMKYALSFADVNELVEVDYAKYTVSPVPA